MGLGLSRRSGCAKAEGCRGGGCGRGCGGREGKGGFGCFGLCLVGCRVSKKLGRRELWLHVRNVVVVRHVDHVMLSDLVDVGVVYEGGLTAFNTVEWLIWPCVCESIGVEGFCCRGCEAELLLASLRLLRSAKILVRVDLVHAVLLSVQTRLQSSNTRLPGSRHVGICSRLSKLCFIDEAIGHEVLLTESREVCVGLGHVGCKQRNVMRICRSMGSRVTRQVERSDCCQTHGFWFGTHKVEHLSLHGGWEC